jgi:hypothetical protein
MFDSLFLIIHFSFINIETLLFRRVNTRVLIYFYYQFIFPLSS